MTRTEIAVSILCAKISARSHGQVYLYSDPEECFKMADEMIKLCMDS